MRIFNCGKFFIIISSSYFVFKLIVNDFNLGSDYKPSIIVLTYGTLLLFTILNRNTDPIKLFEISKLSKFFSEDISRGRVVILFP